MGGGTRELDMGSKLWAPPRVLEWNEVEGGRDVKLLHGFEMEMDGTGSCGNTRERGEGHERCKRTRPVFTFTRIT
jgi:hypothetical protein